MRGQDGVFLPCHVYEVGDLLVFYVYWAHTHEIGLMGFDWFVDS